MVLQMVQNGVFGEITHGEAAYIHDLRGELLRDGGEGLWRREPHKTRDGNFYPTHGLGPVARYMEINRSDRFSHFVSMSSSSKSMQAYRDRGAAEGDASMKSKQSETYKAGDINTSLIKTAQGRTVMLQHDVVSPRPYTRHNMISGSSGAFADFPPRIFLDNGATGSMSHDWQTLDDATKEKYTHPLWKEHGQQAIALGGHGGMDYILNFRLIQCFKMGIVPDITCYDAAAWSAPGPLVSCPSPLQARCVLSRDCRQYVLRIFCARVRQSSPFLLIRLPCASNCMQSEISVAWKSLSLPFPDFTRGEADRAGAAKL